MRIGKEVIIVIVTMVVSILFTNYCFNYSFPKNTNIFYNSNEQKFFVKKIDTDSFPLIEIQVINLLDTSIYFLSSKDFK